MNQVRKKGFIQGITNDKAKMHVNKAMQSPEIVIPMKIIEKKNKILYMKLNFLSSISKTFSEIPSESTNIPNGATRTPNPINRKQTK